MSGASSKWEAGTVRRLVGECFDEGSNCAVSVVRAFTTLGVLSEEEGAGLAGLALGFGKGMGNTHGACGALSGAILVLNTLIAKAGMTKAKAYRITGGYTKRSEKALGAITCRDLLRDKSLNCRQKTQEAAAVLAEYLPKTGLLS